MKSEKLPRGRCREDFSRPSILDQTLDMIIWRCVWFVAFVVIGIIVWRVSR